MIAKDTEALSREELKAVIDYWEDEAENSIHEQIQSIAVAELNKRNTARNSQIKLLNRSLIASSRIGRWRSAAKAFARKPHSTTLSYSYLPDQAIQAQPN